MNEIRYPQWSSNPAQNLNLSNIPGADQVQPKVLPLPNNSWYVSWFTVNPHDPPPQGYDVYHQLLNANGYEQFPHDGVQVAQLTLSSTEDYGLAIDSSGNPLLAFQDRRHRLLRGLAALAWQSGAPGSNEIFIQDVNPDCTLGVEQRFTR